MCCRPGASSPTPLPAFTLNIASLLNAERVPGHSQGEFTCCEEKRGCLDRGEMRCLWDFSRVFAVVSRSIVTARCIWMSELQGGQTTGRTQRVVLSVPELSRGKQREQPRTAGHVRGRLAAKQLCRQGARLGTRQPWSQVHDTSRARTLSLCLPELNQVFYFYFYLIFLFFFPRGWERS